MILISSESPILTSFGLIPVKSNFNRLNRVILTTHGVISKCLLNKLECKLTPQKCPFTLMWHRSVILTQRRSHNDY